jgi:tetratricopeptide (TPR) repeat protein
MLLAQMVEDARRVEDPQTTEWAARTFIERFPRHPNGGSIRERLAELLYRRNDHAGVVTQLNWVLEKGTRASAVMSYYYLGKSLQTKGALPGAEQAMSRFITAASEQKGMTPLLADAYFTMGLGRERSGNANGAITAMTNGLNLAAPERKDQYRFKLADIQARAGRPEAARKLWEQVVKDGNDPEWQALAAQALVNLDVTTQVDRARKMLSK